MYIRHSSVKISCVYSTVNYPKYPVFKKGNIRFFLKRYHYMYLPPSNKYKLLYLVIFFFRCLFPQLDCSEFSINVASEQIHLISSYLYVSYHHQKGVCVFRNQKSGGNFKASVVRTLKKPFFLCVSSLKLLCFLFLIKI